MLRKLLVAVLIFAALLLVAGIYVVHKVNQLSAESQRDVEEERRALPAGVRVGEGLLQYKIIHEVSGIGGISEIRCGWPADQENAKVLIVGGGGAELLDSANQVKWQVTFSEKEVCPVRVVRLGSAGAYGFLTRDQSWARDVVLFDHDGKKLWSYGGTGGVDDSAAGVLSGDEKPRVVVGLNGGGGITMLDENGKKVWHQSDRNVWHVEMLEAKRSGQGRIVHSNASGQLVVRDASGRDVAHYLPGKHVAHFALTRWGQETEANHLLIPVRAADTDCKHATFFVLDSDGSAVAQLDAPLGCLLNRIAGTPVHFSAEAESYAVLQTGTALGRSLLYLYDAQGKLVYQEVIGKACGGLAATPGELGERFLVGCGSTILEYSRVAAATPYGKKTPS